MDYNTLTAQIRSYANRNDDFFVNQIPNFINQGINRIYSEGRGVGFQVIVQGNLTANNPLLAKPANWKETISLSIIVNNKAVFLLERVYETIKALWPNVTLTSTPKYYAERSYNSFYLSPTPNAAYPFSLTYKTTPLFDVTHPTNFLTERYPNLLFYSCMIEAMPFLKDDERLPNFDKLYKEALQDMNNDTLSTHSDRTTQAGKY